MARMTRSWIAAFADMCIQDTKGEGAPEAGARLRIAGPVTSFHGMPILVFHCGIPRAAVAS